MYIIQKVAIILGVPGFVRGNRTMQITCGRDWVKNEVPVFSAVMNRTPEKVRPYQAGQYEQEDIPS